MTEEETPKPGPGLRLDLGGAHDAAVARLRELQAANLKRAEEERAATEAHAAEYLEDLQADHEVLSDWINDRREPIKLTEALAAVVRAKAQELVDLQKAQVQARWTMERTLDDLVQELINQTGMMKPIGRFDYPSGLGTIDALDFMDPSKVEPADMDESMARTSARPRIQEQIDAIRAVSSALIPALNADLEAAERASLRAQRTADAAMSRSERQFNGARTPWSLAAQGAAASFLAFIGAAAAGSVVPSTLVPSVLAMVILVMTSAVAAGLLVRHGRGRGVVAAGAAGIALSFFMAAYLFINVIDPNLIAINGHPMEFIGDAALLSLTVAVSGGTIGVDLAGLARAVAFVQILLTVAAIGVALSWGWSRLVARVDEAPHASDDV